MKHVFACAFLTLLLGLPASSYARPVYAIETGKPCAYCHVDPKGGGPRNPRGLYFATNKHSFKGYDELKVMGRFSAPLLVQEWKETVDANVRKVGIGDTVGDGSNRLVLLTEVNATTRAVTVKKWDGKAWVTEFSREVPGAANRLGVGRYAGSDRPAVIVTSGALLYWEGREYKVIPSSRAVNVLGTIQLKTGAERLLVNDANTVRMYRVDPSKGGDWLTGAIDPPASAETSFSDMKAPTGELSAIGMPDLLAAGEIIGLWDARKADAVFFYGVRVAPIVESKSGADAKDFAEAAQDLVLKGQNYHLSIINPRDQNLKVLWQSEPLDGRVLDVTLHDSRSAERGLTVLTESPDRKGRTLYFFKLL